MRHSTRRLPRLIVVEVETQHVIARIHEAEWEAVNKMEVFTQ
jgi:hypothetical protein